MGCWGGGVGGGSVWVGGWMAYKVRPAQEPFKMLRQTLVPVVSELWLQNVTLTKVCTALKFCSKKDPC